MKRSEFEKKYNEARDQADKCEKAVRRYWKVGKHELRVVHYADWKTHKFDFLVREGGEVSADEYDAIGKYRRAFEAWMQDEVDDLPGAGEP